MPTLLFFRDYRAFQGGHLKVADYIAHTRSSGLFTPQLFMTPGSRSDHPFPRDAIVPAGTQRRPMRCSSPEWTGCICPRGSRIMCR
jgi:hypothetical protein